MIEDLLINATSGVVDPKIDSFVKISGIIINVIFFIVVRKLYDGD